MKIVRAVDHGHPILELTKIGKMIEKHILLIPKFYKTTQIISYIIMPDHVHIIIDICKGQPWSSAPTISQIISSFKTIITKKLGYSIWQRNYFEHIIRNEKELFSIMQYIENNPYKLIDEQEF